MPMDPTEPSRSVPTLHALAGTVVLALWESDDAGGKAVPKAGGQSVPAPVVALTLPLSWGGSRTLVAFRRPPSVEEIDFRGLDGRIVAACAWPGSLTRLPAASLLDGLRAGDQVRAMRFLLQTCRAAFGLGNHAGFVQLCKDAVALVAPTPTALDASLTIADGLVLCQGRLSAGFGTVGDVIVVSDRGVRHNDHLPDVTASGKLRLVLNKDRDDGAVRVVLLGQDSLACRGADLGEANLKLMRWLETAKPTPEQREYVAACLARAATTNPAAAAALREMQLLFPLPKAGVTARGKPVGGEIELAVSHHAGGLFVAGWLHDPHDLIEGITAISATGRRIPVSAPLHRFPRTDVAQHYGTDGRTAGFAGFVALPGEAAPSFQHRFELALRSGELLHLVAPQQPATAAEARNAVLGTVPAQHLTDQALAEVVGPPAAILHARHMTTRQAPEVIEFGTQVARPAVSVVIPLYKVLDFLRFQLGAFAVDPAMAEAELIFVLDSPEQRGQVEHLLRGLHALYAMPMRLVVMSANFGFAAASNAGAALARGRHVLFLNSDVVPDRNGWLPVLRQALEADARLAAVGPKLLFDDDSLQHAGLSFARDFQGAWHNIHFYKGLPRDFAPACEARLVPGVTGACLLVRRSLIERLGGFSEDYIIGDYEDSDLCLRLRQAGFEIGYVPAAELYHLERQSIAQHSGYTKGAACAYNRRVHAERWSALMAELTGETVAVKPAKPGRKRKAAA